MRVLIVASRNSEKSALIPGVHAMVKDSAAKRPGRGRPKSERKQASDSERSIVVRVTPEQHAAIREYCKANSLVMQQWAAKLVLRAAGVEP